MALPVPRSPFRPLAPSALLPQPIIPRLSTVFAVLAAVYFAVLPNRARTALSKRSEDPERSRREPRRMGGFCGFCGSFSVRPSLLALKNRPPPTANATRSSPEPLGPRLGGASRVGEGLARPERRRKARSSSFCSHFIQAALLSRAQSRDAVPRTPPKAGLQSLCEECPFREGHGFRRAVSAPSSTRL